MPVLTFSRYFPATHPKKGQPTYFLERIYKSLYLMKCVPKEIVEAFNFEIMNDDSAPKHHTIRGGNRWKVGDKFSPRVWSGKPYASKQITIGPDIEIKKIWSFEITPTGSNCAVFIDSISRPFDVLDTLSKNDGLSYTDFAHWFSSKQIRDKGFKGQIICWNDSIKY